MNRTDKRFLSDTKGNVAIITAVALGVLILAMAVSIETGRAFLLRNRAVTALDGAVLAAASVATSTASDATVQNRAQVFFDANFPTNYLNAQASKLEVNWDRNAKTITSDMNFKLPLFFHNFLPIDDMNIHIFSQTERVVRNVEIALVIDHTGSLCQPTCAAADNIRKATQTLFETLGTYPRYSLRDINVPHYSYIPFNHSVKYDDHFYYALSNKTDYGLAETSLPNSMGLTPNTQSILDRMDASKPVADSPGGTNTSIGTWLGWRSLRNKAVDLAFFPNGSESEHYRPTIHPAPFRFDPNFDPVNPTFKFMIILTDGINQYFYNGVDYEDTLANADQAKFCAGIKNQGITIFAITYGLPNGGKGATITDIFKKCASEPVADHFFNPDADGTDLVDVFKKIADTISSLVITQ